MSTASSFPVSFVQQNALILLDICAVIIIGTALWPEQTHVVENKLANLLEQSDMHTLPLLPILKQYGQPEKLGMAGGQFFGWGPGVF